MIYLLIGGAGFLLGCAMELPHIGSAGRVRPLLGSAALVLITWSLVMVSVTGERFWMPAWLTATGAATLPLALGLLVYSLFIELPIRRTYVRPQPGPHLTTTGTYALVRHPTLLWFAITLVSLVLVTHSVQLLIALPVWLALDVLWVVLQERLSLPRVFPSYRDYQRTTPMILPNRHSLRTCLATIHPSSGPSAG